MKSVLRPLLARRGDRRWDLFLRATGITAAAAIPVVLAFPRLVPLVGFLLLSIPANSPLSPVIPAAYEPLIMEMVKYYPAIWVSLVAVVMYLYMEYLNWHVYAWVLSWERFGRLRSRRSVRWGMDRFAAAPFWTVVIFAVTPLPFWVARALAILRGYPVRRFLAATALGRFPRYLAYAWVGAWLRVPTVALVAVILGTTAVAVGWRVARGRRLLSEPVLDPENGPPSAPVAPQAPQR
ncbi:MAG: hypothetical protein ACREKI_02760 [Gemmatimonadota bacterium]